MRKPLILHPFLMAVFPPLFLLSRNMKEFPMGVVVAPAAKALAAAALALVLVSLLLRNARKAALLVTLVLVLFGSYGHWLDLLGGIRIELWGFRCGPPVIVAAGYSMCLAVGAYFTLKARGDLVNITKILNVSAGCLVAFSVAGIGLYSIRARGHGFQGSPADNLEADTSRPATPPNIYYIILDGYARADKLQELYGFDNSEFLDELRSKGFYVASGSRPNYSHTSLCLSSTLNLDYLDGLVERIGDETDDGKPLRAMISGSKTRQFLGGLGYKFVAFQSGWQGTEIRDADLYITLGQMGEFERGLRGMTVGATVGGQRGAARRRILYAFRGLPETARIPGPLFVFAHIVCPHPPFVFDAEGADVADERYFRLKSANHLINKHGITRGEYRQLYAQQLAYVNKLLIDALEGIFEASSTPPIIVVQGDHGPGTFFHHASLEGTYLADRFSILNAYYLPGGGEELLYDSITPVNTFRVILNRYFGTDYPLLDDESYYATVHHPYRFTRVTDEIGSREDRKRLEILRSIDYYPDSIVRDRRGGGRKKVRAGAGAGGPGGDERQAPPAM